MNLTYKYIITVKSMYYNAKKYINNVIYYQYITLIIVCILKINIDINRLC